MSPGACDQISTRSFSLKGFFPKCHLTVVTVGQSEPKGTLNNSAGVVGGSLCSCWLCWCSLFFGGGGHVVLTAGGAEIRDRLGGAECGGHLESGRSQFFRNTTSPACFQ